MNTTTTISSSTPVSGYFDDVNVAPMRSMADFLLDKARFQLPSFKDLPKWNNRIISNLLYYQTNYLIIVFVVFLLVGLFHPKDILMGFFALCLLIVVVMYAISQNEQAIQFKREHPVITLLAILIVGYLLVSVISAVIVFIYGIALPLLLVMVHASTRLRNFKAKMNQKMEEVGFKKTAMGQFLELLGVEIELVPLK